MDYLNVVLSLINVIAFILAIKQIKDARELERNLSGRLEDHQALLKTASSQVAQQGETQRNLLNASNTQAEEMHRQVNQILDIRRALTTSFIGGFPDFISPLTSLIESAEKEILIFCDIPAYGCFSSPNSFFDYRQAIERKINKNIKVEITFLSQDLRGKAFEEQFSRHDDNCANWGEDEKRKLEGFLHFYPKSLIPVNLTLDISVLDKARLSALIEALHQFTIEIVSNVVPLESTVAMPLIYWMKDDREAIFAVPAYEGEIKTLAFRTSDRALLDAFKYMSVRYRHVYSSPASNNGLHPTADTSNSI